MSLTIHGALSLFSALVLLASLPSLSVFTVASRAVSLGFCHGVLTSLGVVTGDLIFILIAIYGLAFLAENDLIFTLLRGAGGFYLIYLGINLWSAKLSKYQEKNVTAHSFVASFLAGFSLTLADQKAILFYLGFLPAFLNLATISMADTLVIIVLVIFAVGGVKIIYAWLASRTGFLLNQRFNILINKIGATVMGAVGLVLVWDVIFNS